MKILHINSYFSNRFFYQDLLEEQKKMGISVLTVIPVHKSFVSPYTYDNDVSLIRAYGRFERFIYPVRFAKILKRISQEIDVKEYDLIHAHSLFTNGYIAKLLSKKYNIPYVVTVRNVDINGFFKYGYTIRWVGRNILRRAERVFFLSKAFMRTLETRYYKRIERDKCVVVPNGINNFWQNNRASGRCLNCGEVRFVYAGEINKNKNICASAEAIMAYSKETGKKVSFYVVGEQIDKEVMDKLSQYDFVIIHKPVRKEELIQIYQESDIYIMPSLTESFGLTYAEAMTQGLPVIYTENQGFDGQFEEGDVGYHVKPRDIVNIKQKIQKIVDNYTSISARCVEKSALFAWSEIAAKYGYEYENIMTRKYGDKKC